MYIYIYIYIYLYMYTALVILSKFCMLITILKVSIKYHL